MIYRANIPTPQGMQSIEVRMPTDAEWMSYLRARRVIERRSPDGGTETVVEGGDDANSTLLAAIQNHPDVSVDADTAGLVIERLARVETLSCTCEGASFTVALRQMGQESTHTLSMPSGADLKAESSAVRVIGHGKRGTEFRADLARFAVIYDRLSQSPANILQKRMAVQAVMDEVRDMMSGDSVDF